MARKDAPADFDHDSRSFRRGGWRQYALAEAQAIRETAGLIDGTAFTKHLVTGPGATDFLDWFTCNKLPRVGRINLTYALTPTGTTRTEYTIVRRAENDYYLVSAGAWQAYDSDHLKKSAEDFMAVGGAPVLIQDVTTQWGVFALAGPRARDIMAELIRDPEPATALSNKRFPWLSMKQVELGMVPTMAIRVAYTGELGWELHHPIEMQMNLWDQLLAAGEKHGMKLVGARAQNWLRQEKSYRAFGTELGRDATPLEAGLDRFVDLTKDFLGKDAMLETGIRSKCVTLLIDGPDDFDPWGKEALVSGGEKVGRLTSGGYSVAFGKQIGMGYVPPDLAEPGTRLQVRINGALYDADGDRGQPLRPEERAHPRRRLSAQEGHAAPFRFPTAPAAPEQGGVSTRRAMWLVGAGPDPDGTGLGKGKVFLDGATRTPPSTPRASPPDHSRLHRQRGRVVRLRPLRLPRRRHRPGVLPRQRPHRGADRHLWHLRRRLPDAPARRRGLRLVRRPYGRARTMQISVAMMALPTLLLGILPTFAQVGMLAPALLVLVRLLQGVSVGGEFSSSATYLVETAPTGKRGLTGSWVNIGSMSGSLLGVGAAAAVTNFFPPDTVSAWAWRLPFLGGALLGATAIMIRLNLHNSERFRQHHQGREETSPLLQAFTTNRRETLLALAFAAAYGACYYIAFVYLPEWLSDQNLMRRGTALAINTGMTLLVIPAMPLAAVVGDRWLPRRKWIGLSFLLLALISWPLYAWMLASGGSLAVVIAVHALTFALLSVHAWARHRRSSSRCFPNAIASRATRSPSTSASASSAVSPR